MTTLYLAWQDPVGRAWLTIGRLTANGGEYAFVYTRGAERARSEHNFHPLRQFPSLDEVYESDELFPLFSNRVLSPRRPDYDDFVTRLNAPEDRDDPIALLARSGGRRATDSLEVFPCPTRDEGGQYHIHFFAHGLRHLPDASAERVKELKPGERLVLVPEPENPVDSHAILLCTIETVPGDAVIVGYCPRYLTHDAFEVTGDRLQKVHVEVERVNPPPAPLQLRLLCNLTAPWDDRFRPYATEDYEPIVTESALAVGTPAT